MLQPSQTILQNEQPVDGCKDCAILWYQLVDYRNKWRMRPSEYRWQDLFNGAQDAYLEHWNSHQAMQQPIEAH